MGAPICNVINTGKAMDAVWMNKIIIKSNQFE